MRLTGLSGNEIYCLKLLQMEPGNLVIGNSVFSMGLMGGLRAGFSGMVGGEITDFTSMISEAPGRDRWSRRQRRDRSHERTCLSPRQHRVPEHRLDHPRRAGGRELHLLL